MGKFNFSDFFNFSRTHAQFVVLLFCSLILQNPFFRGGGVSNVSLILNISEMLADDKLMMFDEISLSPKKLTKICPFPLLRIKFIIK